MENPNISLKQDGRYRVRLADDEDETTGIFKGYSSLCGEVAMVIQLSNGKMRFIPLAQIVYIDQLEAPESEKQPKKVDIYYR